MEKLSSLVRKFVSDDSGLESVEYAIILGLIVAGTIGAVTAIGVWVSGQFNGLQTTLGA